MDVILFRRRLLRMSFVRKDTLTHENGNECSLIDGLSPSFVDVGDLNNDGFMDCIHFETCGYCDSTNHFHTQQ